MNPTFLNELAQPYVVGNYMSLKVTPFGKVSIDIIKRYCIGAVFKYFDNPIYVDSPSIQDNLTGSKETIPLSAEASLRHTFHHFYFKTLKDRIVEEKEFPLTFVEQATLFRGEEKDRLTPFTRQTAFQVTDVHSFTLNREQALSDIQGLINCIRSFEKDWQVKFSVKCHVQDNSLIAWQDVQKMWGEEFEVNEVSEEEALIALDFDILLPNGKVIELSALEIFRVQIGGKESILVDFTLGGSERILASMYGTNGKLPFWLTPVQIIALSSSLPRQQIAPTETLRVMLVQNEVQLKEMQQKYQIPLIFDGTEAWDSFREKVKATIPEILSIPLYKPQVVTAEGYGVNDLF